MAARNFDDQSPNSASPGSDALAALRFRRFEPEFAPAFAELNRRWIEEHFTLEPQDEAELANPQASILDEGGEVLFALDGDDVVGTCGLQPDPRDPTSIHLVKMAVRGDQRGRGLGRKLLHEAFRVARELGGTTLFLETSRRLEAAVHLYRSEGFEELECRVPSPYARCDLQMERRLDG